MHEDLVESTSALRCPSECRDEVWKYISRSWRNKMLNCEKKVEYRTYQCSKYGENNDERYWIIYVTYYNSNTVMFRLPEKCLTADISLSAYIKRGSEVYYT